MKKCSFDILRKPLVTEKSTLLMELGKYVFEVSKDATKRSVAKAINEVFGAEVKSVNIINQQGKTKGFRGKKGKRADKKRAVVTLNKGSTLDLV
jgi:large subunit ribosomal protein L23